MREPDDPPRDTLVALGDLFARARYAEVLAITGSLRTRFPSSSNLHYIEGLTHLALGTPDEALPALARSVALAPSEARAWCALGEAQLATGRQAPAREAFQRALDLDARHPEALAGLGALHVKDGDLQRAERCFRDLSDAHPQLAAAWANLGRLLRGRGDLDGAVRCFERLVALEPGSAEAHNDLGLACLDSGDVTAAAQHFRSALALRPDSAMARHNLGLAEYRRGDLQAAAATFRQVLEAAPGSAITHNELGNVLLDDGDLHAARVSFERAREADPACVDALWNLAAVSADIDEACACLERCIGVAPDHEEAALMLAGLSSFRSGRHDLDTLRAGSREQHPFLRSFLWVQALPETPAIHFDRWRFFDAVVAHCETGRPFYEFGVWRGRSFAYLAERLGKGIGFDSFEGLPEDWHDRPAGSYAADGVVPQIEGGEFVVGRFEDTLADFFAEARPLASLLHIDADLYSSTLCALTHARGVIDRRTVVVFDELLMNSRWEEDEYRALEEFCEASGLVYEVLAVSFFSKQVALRFRDPDDR